MNFQFEIISPKHGRFVVTAPSALREKIEAFRWGIQIDRTRAPGYQAWVRRTTRGDGKRGYQSLHRLIWCLLGKGDAPKIDHRDGNPLNNAEDNLRAATSAGNSYNARVPKNSKSGVRGVTWDARRGAWRALVVSDGVAHPIGLFASLREATVARDAAAREYHGEFAFQHQVATQ